MSSHADPAPDSTSSAPAPQPAPPFLVWCLEPNGQQWFVSDFAFPGLQQVYDRAEVNAFRFLDRDNAIAQQRIAFETNQFRQVSVISVATTAGSPVIAESVRYEATGLRAQNDAAAVAMFRQFGDVQLDLNMPPRPDRRLFVSRRTAANAPLAKDTSYATIPRLVIDHHAAGLVFAIRVDGAESSPVVLEIVQVASLTHTLINWLTAQGALQVMP